MPAFKDLTGMRFGRLQVIRRAENRRTTGGHARVMWICICDCNFEKEITISANSLRNNVDSCGCIGKEFMVSFNKSTKSKINVYNLTGEFGIGYTSNTNEEFYFDLEDYEKIKNYCWFSMKGNKDKKSYICARIKGKNNLDKHIRLHRLILNVIDKNIQIDHKNINPNDNRKVNLRICKNIENSRNKNLKVNNKSGFVGVCWNEKNSKWLASIGHQYKRINLGYYKNKEDAIRARLIAEKELHEEFAPQRHLFEQYGIN